MQKGFAPIFIIFLLIIILVIGVGAYLLGTKKNPIIPQQPQGINTSSTPPTSQNNTDNDFFFFSIPKPIKDLTVYQLPNDMNPRNVVQYKDSLWFAGDGSLVEYDTKSGKLASYSNMTKTNCDSNVVMANNFLFTSCHTDNIEDAFGHTEQLTSKIYTGHYSVFKINPLTHQVEHVFTDKDGLQNRYNYTLFADGDTVWIQTFKGIGRINATTNQVKFYTNELGIPGSTLSISWMLVDQNYVWAAIGANVGSQGGLSVFDKNTQTWKSFGPEQLKLYGFDRFDLGSSDNRWAIKSITGGIEISFDEYAVGSKSYCTFRQYQYSSQTWTTKESQPFTGTGCLDRIKTNFPQSPVYSTVDQSGLTQLILPDAGNKNYILDGRNNYILSPTIGDKRYILTSATVDAIDDSSSFRQILVKLGGLPSSGVSYGDPSAYEGLVNFLIDSDNSLAVVADSACGGQGCSGKEKVWLIDLKSAKINRIYTRADGINGELLFNLSMSRDGGLLVIKDKNGKPLFNIDTTNYNLTNLSK